LRARHSYALLCLFAGPALGADILGASYDARTDEILAVIAYRGTSPDHDFGLRWGTCREDGVTARLVDEQGDDEARMGFKVTRRLDLGQLPCRPAIVTLRLGRGSHRSVQVPPRAGALPEARR
jgi:hypothetical protein